MRRSIRVCIWLFLLLIFVMDPKTMQCGVREGIELCLWTLIPTLFPFMILTAILSKEMQCFSVPVFARLEHLLRIPQGYFTIFLIGLLGGYPIGAKCICDCVKENRLSANDGRRMLCFCSNAGPSFIFGLGISFFGSIRVCLQIWLCQILSAILLAMLIPGNQSNPSKVFTSKTITVSMALRSAIESMVMVCGWVILFRVLLCVADKWILDYVSDLTKIVVYGILEMANGCCSLQNIGPEKWKFVLFSTFLGFGGLCVCMQTRSIAENAGVDSSRYLPTKILHGLLAGIFAFAIFHCGWVVLPVFLTILLLIQCVLQKISAGFFYLHDI